MTDDVTGFQGAGPGKSRRRTLAESVTVRRMPSQIADATNKDAPTLTLCLQLFVPPWGPRCVVGCSFAANFGGSADDGPDDADDGPDDRTVGTEINEAGEAGRYADRATGAVFSSVAVVGVIRPVPLPRTPPQWHPTLGQLIGHVLREMGVSPTRLKDDPIVVSLYAREGGVYGPRHLFSPPLPERGYPQWWRVLVPDFAGRVFAADVWLQDLTPALWEGGLEGLARILRPMVRRQGDDIDAGADDPSSATWAAREVRLALYFTCEIQKLRAGGQVAVMRAS